MKTIRTVTLTVTDRFADGTKRDLSETYEAAEMVQCRTGAAVWLWNGFNRMAAKLDAEGRK